MNNLQFANSLKEDGNEWNANNEQVEKVECRTAKRPLVKHEAVRDEFQQQLDCEHRGEEIIEIVENLLGVRLNSNTSAH